MSNSDSALGLSILRDELNVSDDCLEKLKAYVSLLIKWQKVQNLVSRETIDSIWLRHICDSARLSMIVQEPARWLDLGSGAGLPGLVTAILQSGSAGESFEPCVHLVESNTRKASFLRSVIRETELHAKVYNERIEVAVQREEISATHISARALASLDSLFALSKPQTDRGARCYFHKGRDIDAEIEEAANNWDFNLVKHSVWASKQAPSDGIILEVSNINSKLAQGER
ncbi:MAG: 16S rRNA (guanine(527)-N(7))-methyltransferase RsmG [Hyphomicrobiales bacterium]